MSLVRSLPRGAHPAAVPSPSPERSRRARTHLHVVDPGARGRAQNLRYVLRFAGALVMLAVFAAVAFQVVLVQSQFRLEELDSAAASERTRYERLRLEVAELSAPERIVGQATTRLGMVTPVSVGYLRLPWMETQNEQQLPDGAEVAEGWREVKPHLTDRP